MKNPVIPLLLVCLLTSFLFVNKSEIPRLWTNENLKEVLLPVANQDVTITHLTDSLYYGLPEIVMYKTYPFYLPGSEPKGYFDSLATLDPQIMFGTTTEFSDENWVSLGELVYDYPQEIGPYPYNQPQILPIIKQQILEDGTPVSPNGTIPFISLVIRKKGIIEVGSMACANCHNRLEKDGTLYKGGQGNYPFDDNFGNGLTSALGNPNMPDSVKRNIRESAINPLFGAPWVTGGLQEKMKKISNEELTASLKRTFGGVMHRHGTVLGAPTSIPDLYNIKDRKYLDHTGLIQHRSIEDMMLYAALNQQADRYDKFNGSFSMIPWPNEGGPSLVRFSDKQLYALAQYLYTLKPPVNPQKFDEVQLKKGQKVFIEQGCVTCHTPPFYSNNKLTPVDGFEIPENHWGKYDIFNVSVETDPSLALESRRGTGYYKVPSLLGVWNRTALLHSGNITSLEELLDPARLEEVYVPSGYMPGWTETYPVKGHPFGLELSEEDKAALITFLKSL